MFRNYLITTLRNIARNPLYAAISILGLTLGFAAVILLITFVRQEVSYDTWLPGYKSIYRADITRPLLADLVPPGIGPALKLDYPQVRSVARFLPETVALRHGDMEAMEKVYWADPSLFDVLALQAIAGNLQAALQQPNSIALSRTLARKYFGRDDPVGEVIEINREHPMIVTAIFDDLPSNTHLDFDAVASGRAAFSRLAYFDGLPPAFRAYAVSTLTYFKLAPGASIATLNHDLEAFTTRHLSFEIGGVKAKGAMMYEAVSAVHLHRGNFRFSSTRPSGSRQAIYAAAAISILILVVANLNFVGLMTARAARRAVEVGVRKVSGAMRRDLILQFIGESVFFAVAAALAAWGAAELLLPHFNAVLRVSVQSSTLRDPALVIGVGALAIAGGALAGVFPAVVLSSFRPAAVLRSTQIRPGGADLRQVSTALQFALFIGLVVATGIINRQVKFAMNEGLRLDKDQVLVIDTACSVAFKDELLKLHGVRGATCSGVPLGRKLITALSRPKADPVSGGIGAVEPGFFEFYGLKPLAGRFFDKNRPGDSASVQPPVVINEAAVHKLGFGSVQDAVGQTVSWSRYASNGSIVPPQRSEIIGVVADIPIGDVGAGVRAVEPVVFYAETTKALRVFSIKLTGRDIPETLQAIDSLWQKLGEPKPIQRFFLDSYLENLYASVLAEGQTLGVAAGVAIFIACLGLFGLAAFTAESRTKEIGIRKAMGASRADVLRLLLWQFAKPVLWANLIAWPVAGYLMHRWLQGFAYRVDLDPLIFVGASAIALVIALATVVGHALLVSRAKPVTALRYE